VAPTDPLVLRADMLQYDLGEGPVCRRRWRLVLHSTDLASDERWRALRAAAVKLGFVPSSPSSSGRAARAG
jgi:hypothetical protein